MPAPRRRRQAATQLKAVEALRLRALGKSLEECAVAVGWAHKSSAKRAIDDLLAEIKFDAADDYRQLVLARLEAAIAKVAEILYADHAYVSEGRVVDGVYDRAPNLAAAREFRQLHAEIAKLLGLYAPTRKVVEVITTDVVDAAIQNELLAIEAMNTDVDSGRSAAGQAAAPA